jgi:hypothetical protein
MQQWKGNMKISKNMKNCYMFEFESPLGLLIKVDFDYKNVAILLDIDFIK